MVKVKEESDEYLGRKGEWHVGVRTALSTEFAHEVL